MRSRGVASRKVVVALMSIAGCGGSTSQSPPGVAEPAGMAAPAAPKAVSPPAPGPRPGAATKRPSSSEYHGVRVEEDYAWLEDPKDREVKAWSDEQNAATHARLSAAADRPSIEARVSELLTSESPDHFALQYRAGRLFALKTQPPKQQPFLVVLKSAADVGSERIILDPNALDPTGGTTIDLFVVSHDGRRVAVSLSKGGTESGTVSVYDTETGKARGDLVPHAYSGTAGGSLAWNADSTGFYYTRHPHEGERAPADLDFYQQIYFHKLGTDPNTDAYALGKDFPRIAETALRSSEDGRVLLAQVANGDGGEFALYLRGTEGTWSQVAAFSDKIVDARFGRDNSLYLLSIAKKRGQVFRLSRGATQLAKAEVVVPESEAVIKHIAATRARLYLAALAGGPSELRVFSIPATTSAPATVPILPISNVSELETSAGDALWFRNESYLEPPGWYRYDPKTSKTSKTSLFQTTVADMSDTEVVRETCTSKDGTKIPLNVIRRKGTKYDRSNIALLTGYGGYSISRSPHFSPRNRIWLDAGGIIAEANLRGGGEFGEDWHLAGKLVRKQNVFDDFYACAEHLVKEGATAPERLAIIGGSNGGLLMGAEITQHPEMYRAAVSFSGIYDMLKVENSPNGAFNVTEFGSVKDPEQFRALLAYSPYHNVKDGTRYPSVLFLSGANDPRVDPFQSRKMTARLQAATAGQNPILLRTSGETGHGIGTPLSKQIEELTDVYTFLLGELGVRYKGPARAGK